MIEWERLEREFLRSLETLAHIEPAAIEDLEGVTARLRALQGDEDPAEFNKLYEELEALLRVYTVFADVAELKLTVETTQTTVEAHAAPVALPRRDASAGHWQSAGVCCQERNPA